MTTMDDLNLIAADTTRYVFQPAARVYAIITKDGQVQIDWSMVETNSTDVYARLMLAIRDGTWVPLPASLR